MDLAQAFLTPQNTAHRQYEALRAYFVERVPAAEAAQRFGYTVGSFTNWPISFETIPNAVLCRRLAARCQGGGHDARTKSSALRKQNLSIYDISRGTQEGGHPADSGAVAATAPRGGLRQVAATRRRGTAAIGQAHFKPIVRMCEPCRWSHAVSPPSSAACFCFCRRWSEMELQPRHRPLRLSRGRRWCRLPTPCVACWPSSCRAIADTLT